ncbi:MAG: TIGR00341 family protein [Coriobacteriia bacterium]|nr:TIGR00341 family protein [Coriobacteriia bacterium]
MSLRLLEFETHDQETDDVVSLLEEQRTHHIWVARLEDGRATVKVLLDAEWVEDVTDALLSRVGAEKHRMVLLAVEATLPRIEEPEPEQAEETEETTESENGSNLLRISREELYEDLASGTKLTPTYAAMVALSTIVAALGLIRGDVATIIGAMVIAPLLGPNIALSFASTLGDTSLARRAATTLVAGLGIAMVLSVAIGVVLDINPSAPEIASRTSLGFGNIALALAAGAAGSLAFTTGVPAVLVGVMVAVALLPPLATAGMLAGDGHWLQAGGASLLLIANIASVNLAAMATFVAQKIRPRKWWEAERAKKARRIAIAVWAVTLIVLVTIIVVEQVAAV